MSLHMMHYGLRRCANDVQVCIYYSHRECTYGHECLNFISKWELTLWPMYTGHHILEAAENDWGYSHVWERWDLKFNVKKKMAIKIKILFEYMYVWPTWTVIYPFHLAGVEITRHSTLPLKTSPPLPVHSSAFGFAAFFGECSLKSGVGK